MREEKARYKSALPLESLPSGTGKVCLVLGVNQC